MMAESLNEQIFFYSPNVPVVVFFNLCASFSETVSNKLTCKNKGKADFTKTFFQVWLMLLRLNHNEICTLNLFFNTATLKVNLSETLHLRNSVQS